MSDSNTVSVVGANGKLGSLLVDELLRRGAHVRAVVRPGREGTVADAWPERVEVVSADLSDPNTLGAVCAGAMGVVSAVQGGPETIVDGQLALLQACEEQGVRRFFPSDFSFNFFALAPGDNPNSDWRREFAEAAVGVAGEVQVVHVMNGCFIDREVLFGFLGAVDLASSKLELWGDGLEPMDFTTFRDTAAFTAEALLAEGEVPDRLFVSGAVLDVAGLAREIERGTGEPLEIVRRGSLADLDRTIAERQAAAPEDLFSYLSLMYWRGMLNGKGKAPELHNRRFPGVEPMSIADYVAQLERGA
ncbi:MAG: NAD(P)H-binding protein [Planctomycetota bacterium]